jgi:hypothetical protein
VPGSVTLSHSCEDDAEGDEGGKLTSTFVISITI